MSTTMESTIVGAVLALTCLGGIALASQPSAKSPITVELVRGNGFATFTNRAQPDNRIGYRFHEHTPITHGNVPAANKDADIDPDATAKLESSFARRPDVTVNRIKVDEKDWTPQVWTFYLVPVADGIDMLLVVETADLGLNAYYGVQQCFRMSGKTNAEWRRTIAETPAFSEYDLWKGEATNADSKTSLTHVLRKGKWQVLPAGADTVGARTPLGLRIDSQRTGGKLETMPKVGPYEARMLEPIDSGLITRADRQGTWVCGIYWDRTSHVTDHHPADCLHAIVNIGGIPPKSKRAVRGKIYWFKGTLDDLRERWGRDFSHGSKRAVP
ncbi:MAG: hypothetical protein JXQ73_08230 [Phycisphaerae bacterium]|nr:hypothetical protein [Phycisphaerae bacterium]